MMSGPSLKIFSNYLSKIYDLPHESTFPNSATDEQDLQRHISDSSVKPTEQMQNEQSQCGPSHAQKGRQDTILKTAPSVFDGEGAKRSFKFPEHLKEPVRDSHEIPARSTTFEKNQLDGPGNVKMKQSEEGASTNGMADSKRRQSDSKRNHCDKVSVAKDKYPHKPKGSMDNMDDKPSADVNSRKLSEQKESKVCQHVTNEESGDEVKVKQPNGERGVRHVPTVVEHVLQNKMDVLSPISSRRSLSDKGTKSQECSSKTSSLLTILDDSSCSFKEELLSSSYDQGPIRTFGRGELDGPLSQSTLKSALEPAELFTGTQEIKTAADDEETEIWTTAITQESVTEIWTGDVGPRSPDDAKDDILKQSTTKNVGEMQRILERGHNLDSPRKDPIVLVTLEEDTVVDKRPLKDNIASTDSVSNVHKAAKIPQPSSLVLIELKDESAEITNSDSIKGKLLPTVDKEDDEKSDLKERPLNLKLEEIKCKSCQSVLSTREALKMHTCHSILDKLIQSDGGTRRRIFSSPESKAEVSPSPKPATINSASVKAKTKKKVNSIIAIKDDKLAKGELLYDYAPSRKEIEEKIEADRVDETQTKLVSPRLKRSSNVFNLNPPVLHKIKDKPKDEASSSSINSITPKLTKKSKNDSLAKLSSESDNSSTPKLTRKCKNDSPAKLSSESVNSITPKLTKTSKNNSPAKLSSESDNSSTPKLTKKSKNDSPVKLSSESENSTTPKLTIKSKNDSPAKLSSESENSTTPKLTKKSKNDSSAKVSSESENSTTPKPTKKSKNDSSAKLSMESVNSSEVQIIAESGNSIEVEVMVETDQVSKTFETKDSVEAIDTVRAIRHIAKTKAKQKVDLPKQSISQLKLKAECQGLTFKIRHFRRMEKNDEKGRENSGETAYLRGQDNSSQKFDPSSSKVFHQSTHKYREKHSNEKSKDTIHQNKQENGEKHSHDKSKDIQQVKLELKEIDSDEKSKDKHQIKHEIKEKHLDENINIKLEQSEKCSDVKMVKPEKTGEDFDSKKNSGRKSGGNSKDINLIKHEHIIKHSDEKSKGEQGVKPELKEKHSGEKSKDKHQIKHEHKEKYFAEKSKKHEHKDTKYSDVKLVKLEKTGEDCDGKKSSKTDNLSKLNKVKDGNVPKEEKKLEVLARKDSIKKESADMPKTINIVNHFERYNPPIVIQDSPPRKRHKSDMTPTSHKESYERKVKSDEKHSSKRKRNSSPCKSESSPKKFRIPKMEKPAKKVKGFATSKFLQKENIKTLSVGESGISLLESLLSESQKTDYQRKSTEAMAMFDNIDSKQNKMANNKRYEAKDANERSNIVNEGWDETKNVKDDKDRKQLSEKKFGNPVPNHPNNNLTYHGYKRYKSRWETDNYPRPDPSIDFWEDKKRPMFHLTDGEPKPLPGCRFQQRPSVDEDQFSCKASNQKIKLQEFVTFMKTIMYNKKSKKANMGDDKKTKNEGKGEDNKAMEEFEIFLGHYKAGLEETTHFLEFYQNQGQVELEGWQAIQIMELENQFSTFSGYYGPTEELFCVDCKKRHKFAL